MIIKNPYVDFCLIVQAIRREVESIHTPLSPSLGVAASIYTHQIANTLRILTDIRVRHLLADEVGLGKTVQALMVLNALKYQRSDLKALIIVPDRLVPQWRDEIMTRAHTAPIENEENSEETQYIRLAWEAQLKQKNDRGVPKWFLADINPEKYDVLIVDELHRLRADVQDRIISVASEFGHILILTATPAFQHPGRHAQLFAMLEPERYEIIRWEIVHSDRGNREKLSINDELSHWPDWATKKIVDKFLELDRSIASKCPDDFDKKKIVSLIYCAYRRFIRTRRSEYRGVLPNRRHISIETEPIGAEVERQTLMWKYFNYLDQLSRRFDPVLLAKRVILSSPSLEQRVDFLRRKGHERGGILEKVKPLVHRSNGDSRLDALVDLLSEIWKKNNTERVLVAAQDNLTVDFLFDMIQARLPLVGPINDRIPLMTARVRQGMMTEALEDLGGFGNETNENLEAFQRGDAQVLFAPETVQVGLNLQCARIIVLYSVPWRPHEVEQWIGRLDRIGNEAVFSNDNESKYIDVYTIVQRGLVDEKVVTILKRFHVFERGVNLDGNHLEEVATRIENAALNPQTTSWDDLGNDTDIMAIEDEVRELDSIMKPWLPWSVEWAKSMHRQIETTKPIMPVLVELPENLNSGPQSWDRSFEGMLKLLRKSDEYHIRWNNDPEGGRFQTLWYKFGQFGTYGAREVQSKIIFSFGADPGHERSPVHAHAFITRRGDLESPPRRHVNMIINDRTIRRPLHYLNYGDPLHDELIKGWAQLAKQRHTINVNLFHDHKLFLNNEPGLYFVRISVIDPASCLIDHCLDETKIDEIVQAAGLTVPEKLPELLKPVFRKFHCALESDVRWLRMKLSPVFVIGGLKCSNGEWVSINSEEIQYLLNPLSHGSNAIPESNTWEPNIDELELADNALKKLREKDLYAFTQEWSHLLPSFEKSLVERQKIVYEEGCNEVLLVKFERDEAEYKMNQAKEFGNLIQIARSKSMMNNSLDKLETTRVFWKIRNNWLKYINKAIRDLRPIERTTALIRVRQKTP